MVADTDGLETEQSCACGQAKLGPSVFQTWARHDSRRSSSSKVEKREWGCE